jgi:hypothetical protein
VVRKLVNQVASDPLLLAPVREAVVAWSRRCCAWRWRARYFSQEDHPARRLIESVAQRSFRYNDEFSPEFEQFFEPVRQQVEHSTPGQQRSGAFRARRWPNSSRAGPRSMQEEQEAQAQRQLEALRLAEARQELADQIAWEISHRPDIYNAPGIVLDFLYGSWSLVIASAQLTHPDGGPDPQGFRKVISQLLWSTRREVTLRQPKQLFDIVPGMIQTLRRGLEDAGQDTRRDGGLF